MKLKPGDKMIPIPGLEVGEKKTEVIKPDGEKAMLVLIWEGQQENALKYFIQYNSFLH